jgi:uncharacterized membrane protein YhaH (DUF805 family)
MRMDAVTDQAHTLPLWFIPALGLTALPFIWIGASMSVRRARDAGWSGWIGLLFFVPFVNYLVMAALCVPPSSETAQAATPRPAGGEALLGSVLLATMATLLVATGATLLSVHVFGEYGSALFVGTPFVMGVVAARVVHAKGYRGKKTSLLVAALSVGVGGGALLLFALEGVICLTMAAPLALALGLLGALVGDAMARGPLLEVGSTGTLVLALPLLAAFPLLTPGDLPVHSVTTRLEIQAPRDVVWQNVVSFETLPDPEHWIFEAGVAAPLRARIDGEGVGAIRHCEFSTGAFVEPITVWDPPRHLAFDVTDHPPSMREFGLWPVVHAPHVEGAMSSQRGEFRLTPTANGGTLLEGTTWYTLEMAPETYWTAFADVIVHQIHHRVLSHIAHLSERDVRLQRGP